MRKHAYETKKPGRKLGAGKLLLCISLVAAFPARAGTDLTILSLEQLLDLTQYW